METFLGKTIRGRFGFPSGVIATTSDTMRWMALNVPQIGFLVGKSTTIEPRQGNTEDIITQPDECSLWNAVGLANPGLDATLETFTELRKTVPREVLLFPQIGECDEERFARCTEAFDSCGDAVDGIELNLSCPHAERGGIAIGSDPAIVRAVVTAVRRKTEKPIIAKLNAGVPDLGTVAAAAVESGADAIAAINTLGGPNPELSNRYGGLSGPALLPVTLKALQIIREATSVPLIIMGGIRGASDIRRIEESVDTEGSVFAVGSALGGLSSLEIRDYFASLEEDLKRGTDKARRVTLSERLMDYRPLIVEKVIPLSKDLGLLRFYERTDAEPGQFLFLKTGNEESKPFSVAKNDPLELIVRDAGRVTKKILELRKHMVVRMRGPYGKPHRFNEEDTVCFVGAGCGIAPVRLGAAAHKGRKVFVFGVKTASELVYLEEFQQMGEVYCITEDGSYGERGVITDLLSRLLDGPVRTQESGPPARLIRKNRGNIVFYNCGPERMLRRAGKIEAAAVDPDNIYFVVERVTSCGIGICGKCSIPSGLRLCVDGPVFTAEEFEPALYTRDTSGKKVSFD